MSSLSLNGFEPTAMHLLSLLLRQLAYAGLVALIVALPARWLGKRYPGAAHALWSLVLIRLLMPPNWSTSLSLRSLYERWFSPEMVPAAPISPSLSPLSWPQNATVVDFQSVPLDGSFSGSLTLLCWLGLGLLLVIFSGWRRRRYMRLFEQPILDPKVLQRLESWRRQLGIRRQVELWTGDAQQVPFTLGVLRPRIFLPRRFLTLVEGDSNSTGRTAAEMPRDGELLEESLIRDTTHRPSSDSELLDAVLGHELAHVAHGDDLWLHLQRFLLSLYLFFPPLWLACRRMHDARERLADARAIATGFIAPNHYAHALLRVHQMQLNQPRAVCAFGPDPRRLVVRIRSILDLPVSQHAAPTSTAPTASKRRLSWRNIWRHSLAKPSTGLSIAILLSWTLLPMAAAPDSTAEGSGGGDRPTVASAEQASSAPTSTPQTQPLSMQHPLEEARLTASFGPWKSPFKNAVDHHNGLDLASPQGSVIVAPATGVVIAAESDPASLGDYGVVLTIDHGQGVETLYAHLGNILVKVGDQVEVGQPIATVGMSGKTTGPHLHFEVRQQGQLIDPATVIREFC